MTKTIYQIEAEIVNVLKSGKKLSVIEMSRALGTTEGMINRGIYLIKKNVLLPNETIIRTGKYGESKYELLTAATLTEDGVNKIDKNIRSIKRLGIDLTKTIRILNTTRSPQVKAAISQRILQMMSQMSNAMNQTALLQLPTANV